MPVPCSEIVALPPFEVIAKLLVYEVAALGANRTVILHVLEGATVALLHEFATMLNGADGRVTDVIFRLAVPVFVTVTLLFAVKPMTTLPKFIRVGLTCMTGAVGVCPVP